MGADPTYPVLETGAFAAMLPLDIFFLNSYIIIIPKKFSKVKKFQKKFKIFLFDFEKKFWYNFHIYWR